VIQNLIKFEYVVVELLYQEPHAFWWGGPHTGVGRLLVEHVNKKAITNTEDAHAISLASNKQKTAMQLSRNSKELLKKGIKVDKKTISMFAPSCFPKKHMLKSNCMYLFCSMSGVHLEQARWDERSPVRRFSLEVRIRHSI
jgi:hypothetical protein